jgi:hypothetical protein
MARVGRLPGALQGPDAGRGAARRGNLRRADDTVSMANIASAFVWAFVMLAPGAGLTALAK